MNPLSEALVAKRGQPLPNTIDIGSLNWEKIDLRKKEDYGRSVAEILRLLHCCDDIHWGPGENAGPSCCSFLDVMRRLFCREKATRRFGITNFCGVSFNDTTGVYRRYGKHLYSRLLDWAIAEDILVLMWTGGGPGDGMDVQCRIFNEVARKKNVLYAPPHHSEHDGVGLDHCHAAVAQVLAHIPCEKPNGQSSPFLTVRPSGYLPLRGQMLTAASDWVNCEPFGKGGAAEDPAVGLDNQLCSINGLNVVGSRVMTYLDSKLTPEACETAGVPAGTYYFDWLDARDRITTASGYANPRDYQLDCRVKIDENPEEEAERMADLMIRWWIASQPIREFEIMKVREAIESI